MITTAGKLYMLQTRSGKRTGAAAIKIAVDMVYEGLITRNRAISLVKPDHLNQLLHPQFKVRQINPCMPCLANQLVNRIPSRSYTSRASLLLACQRHQVLQLVKYFLLLKESKRPKQLV
jgi:phosphoenolpyruvate synthase/pyruvate phosphate dikinase